jgi:hypothetical protein
VPGRFRFPGLGTVHFSGTRFNEVLPGDYTFTAADQGSHRFTGLAVPKGYTTITVTDTQNPALTGSITVLGILNCC